MKYVPLPIKRVETGKPLPVPVWDAKGNRVTDPTQDRCGKKLSDCRLRFGADPLGLPFGAFPGMMRI